MADGSVISMASGTVPSPNAGGGKADRGGDKSPFLGLLRALTRAAESGDAESRKTSTGDNRNDGGDRGELPPRRKEAVDRVAMLATDGSVDRKLLEEMPTEEWDELEDWVLAGAGGVFPHYDVEEFEGVPVTGDVQPREMLLDLLSQLLSAVAAADISEADGDVSMVAAALGLGSLADGKVEKMAEFLLNGLIDSATANTGTTSPPSETLPATLQMPDLSQALGNISHEELVSLLQQAAVAAGADVGDLESLPMAVLRSLAVEILDVEVKDGGVGADLLRQLSGDGSLRQRLVGENLGAGGETDDNGGKSSLLVKDGPLASRSTDQPTSVHSGDTADPQTKQEPLDTADPQTKQEPLEPADSQAKQGRVDFALEYESAPSPALSTDRDLPDTLRAAQDQSPVQISAEKAMPVQTDALPKIEQPAAIEVQAAPAGGPAPSAEPQLSDAARAVIMAENIERVEQMMKLSVRRGLQQVTLQLSPPELGKVKIRIQMRQGVMSAVLQTDTSDARNALLFHVEQLRQSLQVQGIELDKFDVQLGGHQLNEGRSGHQRKNRRLSLTNDDAGNTETNDQESFMTWHDGSLNLVV